MCFLDALGVFAEYFLLLLWAVMSMLCYITESIRDIDLLTQTDKKSAKKMMGKKPGRKSGHEGASPPTGLTHEGRVTSAGDRGHRGLEWVVFIPETRG